MNSRPDAFVELASILATAYLRLREQRAASRPASRRVVYGRAVAHICRRCHPPAGDAEVADA